MLIKQIKSFFLWLRRRCPYCEEKHHGRLMQCESCGEIICPECAVDENGLYICEKESCQNAFEGRWTNAKDNLK